ncbi:MAG: polymer-forming cytoskeletal protein [Alphaproteobacteria bacterium]|nr:polymer-forming cytoskeletal protein [Alphaproteobacteria bacterium]
MAIFGRKKEETPAPDAPVSVPATRDTDVAMPGLRPAAPMAKEGPTMSQPPKPTMAPPPSAMPPRPGMPGAPGAVGVPVRPQPAPALTGDRRTLLVGKGISVQGTIADCERLVVEGTVESQMLQAAELSISATGIFRGEVQVEDADISGLFDGTITARGNLTIRATGKVNGVARSKRLSVEDGGQLMGRMEMLTEGSAAAPAAAPAMPPRPAAIG